MNRPEDDAGPALFKVEIAPQGWQFDCAPDQTLLLAALEWGFRMPHSCRNGSCRACIARLLAGRIEHRIEWPGLSAEEKAEGWILPCVACPREPLRVEAPATVSLFDAP
ncbi:2Fe-2S iron-sulfur cluster binding domain-containing protein [Roseateles sp. DAIF2]|uniref:2Fe-2S iron-sulfur cluster-binding protein n=1 Tax=Roseateles sp. DAIF2 TaxID=2714952 RepID=UPI0018A2E3DB|nr:2Fe-2S iron-sulfur cluster-binding protein [Roseateles sp. DAIF2]QPF73177.1 2Fe-2S iron-sulfur cluster binding domain-containing protein [Roseateles sp. DAIF2]